MFAHFGRKALQSWTLRRFTLDDSHSKTLQSKLSFHNINYTTFLVTHITIKQKLCRISRRNFNCCIKTHIKRKMKIIVHITVENGKFSQAFKHLFLTIQIKLRRIYKILAKFLFKRAVTSPEHWNQQLVGCH